MLYITEDTVYCMQINHGRGTLGNNLRYGIAEDSLKTIRMYSCNRVKKTYKYIKRYRMLENLHKTKKHKDNTCEVRVTHEGKPRGGMDKRLNKEINIRNIFNNTVSKGKLKYVHIIPHEYCPDNFVVLEIVPQTTDRNNNNTVPETTAKRKVTRNIKPKRITSNSRHCSKG